MKLFAKKIKDERVSVEVNKIYKIGYYILSFGILLDLYLQFAGGAPQQSGALFSCRPVEFTAFMLAQILCIVLMTRKGLVDDDVRYADAECFPKRRYALISIGAGATAGVLFSVLRFAVFHQSIDMPIKAVMIAAGLTFLFLTVIASALVYVLYYLLFRIAKKRQASLLRDDTTDEEN